MGWQALEQASFSIWWLAELVDLFLSLE